MIFKKFYDLTLEEFQKGLDDFARKIQNISPLSKIILVAPAKLNLKAINSSFFKQLFNEISVDKSYKLAPIYKNTAQNFDCIFFDLNDIIEVSEIDGLHFEPLEHLKLAQALLPVVNKIIF